MIDQKIIDLASIIFAEAVNRGLPLPDGDFYNVRKAALSALKAADVFFEQVDNQMIKNEKD